MNKDSMKILRIVVILVIVAFGLQACSLGGDSSDDGQSDTLAGNATNGETIFSGLCAVCHAPDGTGIPGLGKDLTTSEFATGLSDQELVDFLIEGRLADDPANSTGVAMPPKGGNPALTDQDLADVVAFLRTLAE